MKPYTNEQKHSKQQARDKTDETLQILVRRHLAEAIYATYLFVGQAWEDSVICFTNTD